MIKNPGDSKALFWTQVVWPGRQAKGMATTIKRLQDREMKDLTRGHKMPLVQVPHTWWSRMFAEYSLNKRKDWVRKVGFQSLLEVA